MDNTFQTHLCASMEFIELFLIFAAFYPRPADSIGHLDVPPSVKKNQIQISLLWDLIETWGFRVDDPFLATSTDKIGFTCRSNISWLHITANDQT